MPLPIQQPPDYSDSVAVADKLLAASKRLSDLSASVASARQVRDYDSDRRRRALSVSVVRYLDAGNSAAAAEFKARASDEYGSALHELKLQLESAEKAISEWEAARTHFDALRSVLSIQKAIAGQV